MDDGLKQRLVGAVVLVAIAVIFLPSLFDRDTSRSVDLKSQVPPEPVVVAEPLVIALPRPPENAMPAKPLSENYDHSVVDGEEVVPPLSTVDASATEAERAAKSPRLLSGDPIVSKQQPSTESVLDVNGVPYAWSIQVASFSATTRADAMLQTLSQKGYQRAYIRKGISGDKTVYRVFVGPKIDKRVALAEQEKLNQILNTKTLLVKFQP